jgi:hypothetical protein
MMEFSASKRKIEKSLVLSVFAATRKSEYSGTGEA